MRQFFMNEILVSKLPYQPILRYFCLQMSRVVTGVRATIVTRLASIRPSSRKYFFAILAVINLSIRYHPPNGYTAFGGMLDDSIALFF